MAFNFDQQLLTAQVPLEERDTARCQEGDSERPTDGCEVIMVAYIHFQRGSTPCPEFVSVQKSPRMVDQRTQIFESFSRLLIRQTEMSTCVTHHAGRSRDEELCAMIGPAEGRPRE